MMNCANCERDVHPVMDLAASGKVVPVCGTCQAPLGSLADAVPSFAAPPRKASAVVPVNDTATAPAAAAPPLDLLSQARAQLATIDEELKRLEGLQRERRKLAAMIAAAEAADETAHHHAAE